MAPVSSPAATRRAAVESAQLTDVASGFVKGIEAFAHTRLAGLAGTSFTDAVPFLESIVTFDAAQRKPAFERLKADVKALTAAGTVVAEKIKKQTDLITKVIKESADDLDDDDFGPDTAARVAIRLGTALAAMDEAFAIVATELAKDAAGTVDEVAKAAMMEFWDPWAQPFKDLGAGSGKLLDAFGSNVLKTPDLTRKLGDVVRLDRSGGAFLLVAKLGNLGPIGYGSLSSDQVDLELFLQFSDKEVVNPPDAIKPDLLQRGEKWFRPDVAILGLRLRTHLRPGLTENKLLAQVMPGAPKPETTTLTTISLDTAQGFYLGDGVRNERAVLATRFSFPGVELREVAFGLRRNDAREVVGFELTTSIAAVLGAVVGMQVVGAGATVALEGGAANEAVFDEPVALRWPDAVGLRITAGPVTGAGFIQRVQRTYAIPDPDFPDDPTKATKLVRTEFGGTLQLTIMKFGVSAIVVLSPEPFSLVLVIGVRFPVAIDVGLGFTLNAIGGILAVNRGIDLKELRSGVQTHVLDKMLFPDAPVADPPALLDKVAKIFPPRDDSFVVGPIVELGWGSQAKFVELKLGVVFALPDPTIVVLGSLRVRAPTKDAKITDITADVFIAVTPDSLLLFASMSDSTIGTYKVSGELGLYIQWSGGTAFELSVGGFHPEYEKLTGGKPKLGELARVTIDLSPSAVVSFKITAYFAVTAGAVMLGVKGELKADFKIASVRAWITLDVIFIWSPRFGFKISIEIGVEVELLGFSFAKVVFRGYLAGTAPFEVGGHVTIDVWFLPTFDKDLGPITWGDPPKQLPPAVSPLALAVAALRERDAWRVALPDHAAQLVTLAAVDPGGPPGRIAKVAHPLAALEVSQSAVPLGVTLARVGTAPVTADAVVLGAPTTSGDLAVGAVSELRTSFAPGQFFDLEGEALLARAGFEDLVGGCRIAAAVTPRVPARASGTVSYQTLVRRASEKDLSVFDGRIASYASDYVGRTVVGRRAATAVANPYLGPPEPGPVAVAVAPRGTSVLTDGRTGAGLLTELGAVTTAEAGVLLDAFAALGADQFVRTGVQG